MREYNMLTIHEKVNFRYHLFVNTNFNKDKIRKKILAKTMPVLETRAGSPYGFVFISEDGKIHLRKITRYETKCEN